MDNFRLKYISSYSFLQLPFFPSNLSPFSSSTTLWMCVTETTLVITWFSQEQVKKDHGYSNVKHQAQKKRDVLWSGYQVKYNRKNQADSLTSSQRAEDSLLRERTISLFSVNNALLMFAAQTECNSRDL